MSYHLSLFIFFTPLYISLIYGVFLNKALQVFDDKKILCCIHMWGAQSLCVANQ
jgi:hypothetical protein